MGQFEKVVVIGSNSVTGASFIDHLLELGKYDIIGISRSAEKKDLYLPYKRHGKSAFRFHQLDLNSDINKILTLLDDEQPPYVVNFASQSMVGESWDNPVHWYQTNVISTVNLVNHLKNSVSLKKYVHISTPEVYGSCSENVTESQPFNPSTPYAGSRAAADTFILMLVKQFGFPAVFTRAANVYGKGQQLFKIIPRAIIFMNQGKKIPLHGGGLAERSFIHLKDVCEGTLEVMLHAKPGEIYHFSTDTLISVRDLVKKICLLKNKNYEDCVEMVETRRGLDMAYILDSAKAKRDFNWSPRISLEDGLSGVIDWIDAHREIISHEPLSYIHLP